MKKPLVSKDIWVFMFLPCRKLRGRGSGLRKLVRSREDTATTEAGRNAFYHSMEEATIPLLPAKFLRILTQTFVVQNQLNSVRERKMYGFERQNQSSVLHGGRKITILLVRT